MINGRKQNTSLPVPHSHYRPDIEGLRGLSALMVFISHYFLNKIPGGFTGVDMFFVISGYLISSILFRAYNHNMFIYRDFYVRRILRIFPALALTLSVLIIVDFFLVSPEAYQFIGRHIVAGVSFCANFVLLADAQRDLDLLPWAFPLHHLWSLGVEEQFYLFWPFVIRLLWKRQDRFLIRCIWIMGISFFLNISLVHYFPSSVFYAPTTRLWELMFGCIPAYIFFRASSKSLPKVFSYPNIQSIIGAILVTLGATFITLDCAYPGYWALLPCLGTLLLISGHHSWINRKILSNKLFIFIGLISYPLYLCDWVFLSMVRYTGINHFLLPVYTKLGMMLGNILFAYLVFRFIEKPMRYGKKNRGRRAIILCVIMAIIGMIGHVIHGHWGY